MITLADLQAFDPGGNWNTTKYNAWLNAPAAISATNLVPNPSFELNTTGWGANGLTYERSADNPQSGSYSLYAHTDSVDNGQYVYADFITISPDTDYVLSLYITLATKTGTGTIYLEWYTSGEALISTETWVLPSGNIDSATRFSLGVTSPSSAAKAMIKVTPDGCTLTSAFTIYIDAIQLESGTVTQDYCDGSLGDGYFWTDATHNSASSRLSGSTIPSMQVLLRQHSPEWVLHDEATFPDAASSLCSMLVLGTQLVRAYYDTTNSHLKVDYLDNEDAADDTWTNSYTGDLADVISISAVKYVDGATSYCEVFALTTDGTVYLLHCVYPLLTENWVLEEVGAVTGAVSLSAYCTGVSQVKPGYVVARMPDNDAGLWYVTDVSLASNWTPDTLTNLVTWPYWINSVSVVLVTDPKSGESGYLKRVFAITDMPPLVSYVSDPDVTDNLKLYLTRVNALVEVIDGKFVPIQTFDRQNYDYLNTDRIALNDVSATVIGEMTYIVYSRDYMPGEIASTSYRSIRIAKEIIRSSNSFDNLYGIRTYESPVVCPLIWYNTSTETYELYEKSPFYSDAKTREDAREATALLGNGKYVYLFSGYTTYRTILTAFFGTPDTSVVEDITDSVYGMTSTSGQVRNISIDLANPRGALMTGLLGKAAALEVIIKMGNGGVTPVTAQILQGSVASVTNSNNNRITLTVSDGLARLNAVKSPDSHDWDSGITASDDFRDTVGNGSGSLKRMAIKQGAFSGGTGGVDTSSLLVPLPTSMTSSYLVNDRCVAFSTLMPKSTSGFVSTKITIPYNVGNSTVEAGLVFHGLDKNNYKAVFVTSENTLLIKTTLRGVSHVVLDYTPPAFTGPYMAIDFSATTVQPYQSTDGQIWTAVGDPVDFIGLGTETFDVNGEYTDPATGYRWPVASGSVGVYCQYNCTYLPVVSNVITAPVANGGTLPDRFFGRWEGTTIWPIPFPAALHEGWNIKLSQAGSGGGWSTEAVVQYCVYPPNHELHSQKCNPPQPFTFDMLCDDETPCTAYWYYISPCPAMDFLTTCDDCPQGTYVESTTAFEEGTYYIIPAGATGVWAGMTNYITVYKHFTETWWSYLLPDGSVAYIESAGKYYIYHGSQWQEYKYAVKFNSFHCENHMPVMDGMDAMRIAGAYGGIHASGGKYQLQADYAGAYDADDYVLTADGTWSHTGGQLRGIGTGAGSHYGVCYHDQVVQLPVTVNFIPGSTTGAFAFGPETPLGSCYSNLIRWTGTTIEVRLAVNDNEYDLIRRSTLKHGSLVDKHVKISIRVQRASVLRTPGINPDSSWTVVDVFADGLHEFSYAYNYYSFSNPYLGFAVAPGETSDYDDLEIYELGKPVDVMTLDPNEAAATCLTRAIQQSSVNIFSRFDASIYGALATVDGDAVWTLPTSSPYNTEVGINFQAPNSLRLTGAWNDAEDIVPNPSLGGVRLFERLDDANLVGESSEYYQRLQNEVRQTLNRRIALSSVISPPCYALEQQDVISYVSGLNGVWGTAINKFVIQAINLGISKSEQAPKPTLGIQASSLEDPYEPT